MKAQKVFENMSFKRGKDVITALGIGMKKTLRMYIDLKRKYNRERSNAIDAMAYVIAYIEKEYKGTNISGDVFQYQFQDGTVGDGYYISLDATVLTDKDNDEIAKDLRKSDNKISSSIEIHQYGAGEDDES